MVKGDSLDSTLESVCCGEKRGKVKKNESSHKNMRIKMHKMYIRLKLLQFPPMIYLVLRIRTTLCGNCQNCWREMQRQRHLNKTLRFTILQSWNFAMNNQMFQSLATLFQLGDQFNQSSEQRNEDEENEFFTETKKRSHDYVGVDETRERRNKHKTEIVMDAKVSK